MSDESTIKHDLLKQQFDILTQWSRFYHDAEIRVNSSSLVISAIAVVGDKIAANSIMLKVMGTSLNPLGLLIMVASVAAFISTLGYWRYYEMCDMLAKYYRNIYIPQEIRDSIRVYIKREFTKKHSILSQIPDNAHHYVWLFTQFAFFLLGAFLALYPKA